MMMQSLLKKHKTCIQVGDVMTGKWHRRSYKIKAKLGAGAVGTVYLCECEGRHYALKISDTASQMTLEMNTLKALKQHRVAVGPALIEADDWVFSPETQYSFYVMEYIHGESLETFLQKYGTKWIGLFLIQLLQQLSALHEAGFIFGDLKLENMLVDKRDMRLRFVDVGGVTKVGRAIKEYTAFCDRASWQLGSRKAEASYDLFALVMTCLQIFHREQSIPDSQAVSHLSLKIKQIAALRAYERPLLKAVRGEFHSAKQMERELCPLIQKEIHQKEAVKQQNQKAMNQPPRSSGQQKHRNCWRESAMITFVSCLFYLCSLFV